MTKQQIQKMEELVKRYGRLKHKSSKALHYENGYKAGYQAAMSEVQVLVEALRNITICSSRDSASYQASEALKNWRDGNE